MNYECENNQYISVEATNIKSDIKINNNEINININIKGNINENNCSINLTKESNIKKLQNDLEKYIKSITEESINNIRKEYQTDIFGFLDIIYKTDYNMYAVEMSVDEYERYGIVTLADGTKRKAVVLWNEIGAINNTYASYYIREGTPIYWDAIGNETPKQYSYLYNIDGELLKISIDPCTFGQIIVPGDHLNVRAAYT